MAKKNDNPQMKQVILFRVDRVANYKKLEESYSDLKSKFEKELYKSRFEVVSKELWEAVFCVLIGNTATKYNQRFDFRKDDFGLVNALLQCYSTKKICLKGDCSVELSEKQVELVKKVLSDEIIKRSLIYRSPTPKEVREMIKNNQCNSVWLNDAIYSVGLNPEDFALEIEKKEIPYDDKGAKTIIEHIKKYDADKLLKNEKIIEWYAQNGDIEIKQPFEVSDLKGLQKRLKEMIEHNADYLNQFASRKNEKPLAITYIFRKVSLSDSAKDCHLLGSILDLFGLIDAELKESWKKTGKYNEKRKQWVKAIYRDEVEKYLFMIENRNPSYTKNMLLPLEYAKLKVFTGSELRGKLKQ